MATADAGDKYGFAEIDASEITPVSPAEFAAGVSGTQVTVLLADLEVVHGYARHFDCDEDPSMIRIRKAIEDAEQEVAERHGRPEPPARS